MDVIIAPHSPSSLLAAGDLSNTPFQLKKAMKQNKEEDRPGLSSRGIAQWRLIERDGMKIRRFFVMRSENKIMWKKINKYDLINLLAFGWVGVPPMQPEALYV